MGLFRLLFWIVILFVAIWVWRRYISAPKRPRHTQRQDEPAAMVRCAHCGVHIPQLQALSQGQHWYCSQRHLAQGPQRRDR